MTQLIAKQHLLPSTVWMAGQLARRARFSTMTFVGKPYSTIPAALAAISAFAEVAPSNAQGFSRLDGRSPLLLLDEGGALHDALPDMAAPRTALVEQTTFGLRAAWRCPTVLVCRSAAKLVFEAQIIARGLIRKLESVGLGPGMRFAVLGTGALGGAMARALLRRGAKVACFDKRPLPADLVVYAGGLHEILSGADVILGCTGADALEGVDLTRIGGRKVFASCSSGRVEFASLAPGGEGDRYADAAGAGGNPDWILLNGGFPINFDREREWEHFEEIVLTRQLMLEGAVEAATLFGARPGGYMMSPAKQHQIVTAWLDQVPERSDLIVPAKFSEAFLRVHSEGEYLMAPKPYQLHSTTPGALARMRSHTEPYDVEIAGLPITVNPGVWSPAYDWSSHFYIENMQGVAGRSFLEIGSGTGVISVFAGRDGATSLLAVDANPDAVENTRQNFERHGLKNAAVALSEGFDNVRGRFDTVVWNAPYHGVRPADDLERGCADEDYRGIRGFFRDVGAHLNPGGRIVFGFSESGDLPLIEALIDQAGLRVVRKLSDWREGYNCILFDLAASAAR